MVAIAAFVRRLGGAAMLFAILALTFPAALRSQPHPLLDDARRFDSKIIREIRFEPAEQPFPLEQLRALLPFRSGSVFHIDELQTAVQSLFATGRFSNLQVEAHDQSAGMALTFVTEPAYFVGHVSIFGVKTPPNTGQLFGAAKLSLGARYFDTDRARATNAMLEQLRNNGFYHARVDSHVEYQTQAQEADVTFDIQTGQRARFASPLLTGRPERPYQSIIFATHWKKFYGLLGWHELTASRLQQGLGNVRRYYERRDLLRSQISLTKLEFSEDTNTVRPDLNIEAGPRILIRVVGFRLSRGKLKQLVPAFQERSVDTDLIVEGQRNIQRYMQSIGYFGASVSYETDAKTGAAAQLITYRVARGRIHRLVAVLIHGNHFFMSATLHERLLILPAEFPRFPRGRFSDDYLRNDVQNLLALYRSNGFRDVKVSSRIVDDYRGARDQIAVELSITEGPQTFVSNLTIEGVMPPDLRAISGMLSLGKGQPFSDVNVALDRDNILRFFYNQGFLDAAFEFYVTPEQDASRVDVRYSVRQGLRSFVRDVIVSGLQTTKRKLVMDRISLAKGEPISLDEETGSQQRLYNLGIFARVSAALQNPEGSEPDKYVLYDVDEARHYALNLGVGAQIARIGGGVTTLDNPAGTAGFAPRVALGLTRENFLGLGQTLGVQTSVSTIRQRGAVTYFIPQFVSHENLNLTVTALLDNSNDIRTFSAHRREASIQLGERLSRAYTFQYRLVLRHVTQSNLKINSLLVPLLSQPETVGLTEVSLIQDKRDDPTDAHHGIYSTLDIGYAPNFLGSQTQFARGLVRNSTYYQLSRDLVLARSTQFGVITRTGGRPSIPLAERLYSGGSTSIRAFPDFQAGPRDLVTGFPLGGNALFINNTELRFPLYGENLGGVLFHDAGNVYSSLGNISFRFRQRDLQDFDYLVHSFGLGVRYRTPIGPLRIDLSVSPDAPRFFGLKGTLQDYLNGQAIATTQKINAFQFHISLGQAF